MKNTLFVSLSILMLSTWAISPEDQIEKLFSNIMAGKTQAEKIIAPDNDTMLIKLLGPEVARNDGNLTERLFIFELTQFLKNQTKEIFYSITIYSLENGIASYKIREKIKTIEIKRPVSPETVVRYFSVIISMGKDYPKEKIILLVMRKNNESYIIEPNACVFGGDSFLHFSGFTYNHKDNTFSWEKNKKTAFIQYLKNK